MRIAVIPARGGSRRVPRKNIAELAGRPMLSYPVRAARDSGLFDGIYVSTEDTEIAAVARDAGAAVIDRPATIAGDRNTVVEVCLHALEALEARGQAAGTLCCLYATAVFVTPDDLAASLALLDDSSAADGVMGVSGYPVSPVKALTRENGFWKPMWPEYQTVQSQFLPHLVASNGTLYWIRTAALRAARSFYVERLKCYELPRTRAVDIDSPDDLEEARRLMDAHQRETTP